MSRLKDRLNSITDNIIANLVVAGGGVLIAFLVARSAFIEGLPLYRIIIWGLAALALFALAANYISITLIRHAKDRRESKDKWLHEIAETDRKEINSMVRVLEILRKDYNYKSATPFIEFSIQIFNGSIYPISIEHKVSGFIAYGKRRLTGEIAMSAKWVAGEIPRGWTAFLVLNQGLTQDEASFLATDPNAHSNYFEFEHLVINIMGGVHFDNVRPMPIKLTGGVDQSGKQR
jgi:hypothetical protein